MSQIKYFPFFKNGDENSNMMLTKTLFPFLNGIDFLFR